VARLYTIECIFGFIALIQGTVGTILVDKIRNQKLVSFLIKMSKIDIALYFLFAFLRLILFFDVHTGIAEVSPNHKDKGLGSFMAEYLKDTAGSTILTLFLLGCFLLFFASNFYIIKLLEKMLDFMLQQEKQA